MAVQLIGVPFDSAGTSGGVASAPSALRQAGLLEALLTAGVPAADGADVALGPTSPDRDPESGIIAPDALAAMIEAVRETVAACHESGAFPIVLGGDCPVLIGCLAACPDPIGLLFVDGHEDAWPPHASTTGEAADMELGFLLGRTTELPHSLRALIPRLDPERIVLIGARDQAELREAGVPSVNGVVEVVRTEGMTASGIELAAEERIGRLDDLGKWWLHVDLDVLSTPSLAAVDYQQPGGVDWSTLSALTQQALSSHNVIGWTVTIYNPDLDPDWIGAAAIVDYVARSAAAIGAR